MKINFKKIMHNKELEEKNKIEERADKKNESLDNLRKYVLEEIEDKKFKQKEKKQHEVKLIKKKKEKRKFKTLEKDKPKKNKSNLSKWIKRTFIILLIILFFFFLIIIPGIYYFKWDDIYTNTITKHLPLPIAIVGHNVILYKNFNDLSKAYFRSLKKNGNPNKLDEIKNNIQTDILNKLIDKKIIENISQEKNIFATKEEIDSYYQRYLNEAGSEENLRKIILDMYGWDLPKFKKEILSPFILQNKLNNYFIWSKDFNQRNEKLANNILFKLKKDNSLKNFTKLVKKFSQDIVTKNKGGDLGWFGKDKMVENFEKVAFALQPGQISGVVRTIYGFHIIMVDEVNEDEGKIKARHILIKAHNLDDAITQEKKKIKIIKFLK